MNIKVFKVVLTVHDFFFYVSRELKVGAPSSLIHNTALMYALNTHVPQTQRLVSGVTPFYSRDFKLFTVYCTPAVLSFAKIINVAYLDREWQREVSGKVTFNPVKITYNSVNELLAFAMEKKKIAVPKVGSYLKFPPLTTFLFFTVGGVGPKVLRIGKKLIQARVEYEKLRNIQVKIGKYKPSHPVNLNDLENQKILSGEVRVMPPSPLMLKASLEGKYLECEDSKGNIYCIAHPSERIYSNVSWDGN